ncbi:hypothetical protein DFH29DRAFT_948905, partial [Suillus ampliporus]
SAATFWTYDYVCSLHQELTFLLRSRWTKVKGLYIATRYTPFLLFTGHLYLNFIPNDDPNKCQTLNNICSCFFIIRTYALWNNNKIVLGGMLSAFFVSPMPSPHPTLVAATSPQEASSSSYRLFSCSRSN